MMISLEVWKFGSLQIVCDDDKFGSLEVYTLCVMMISLEVWKFTITLCVMISLEVWKFTIVCDDEVWKFGSLHVVCDDDKFGSLEVYTLCVMMISLEVWKFEVTYCV